MMRKHISVAIVIGLLLAAMVFAAGCTSSPTPSVPATTKAPNFIPKNTSGYLTYSNRSAGISMQYPASWQANNGSGNEIVSFNFPSMSFTVITQEFSGTATTLNDFSRDALPRNLTDFKLLNSTDATLSGYPAEKQVFTYTKFEGTVGTTSQGMLEVTIANRTGYGLLYVATQSLYPSYLGIVQNMTLSFNVTK
jgi:hypothetical protein